MLDASMHPHSRVWCYNVCGDLRHSTSIPAEKSEKLNRGLEIEWCRYVISHNKHSDCSSSAPPFYAVMQGPPCSAAEK